MSLCTMHVLNLKDWPAPHVFQLSPEAAQTGKTLQGAVDTALAEASEVRIRKDSSCLPTCTCRSAVAFSLLVAGRQRSRGRFTGSPRN